MTNVQSRSNILRTSSIINSRFLTTVLHSLGNVDFKPKCIILCGYFLINAIQLSIISVFFCDLAAYTIVTENNAGQYYPDYAYNHPLFTQGMKLYSDSKVSSFINSITRDQCIAFQNEWNSRHDHCEKIYISYDSTNKNC